MICISVLLPDPFSPTRPTSSPGRTSSDAPRRTSTRRRCHGGPDENAFVDAIDREHRLCGDDGGGHGVLPYR